MATVSRRFSSHKHNLRSAGMVEALVAMVILLTVFAVGMLIFTNLTQSLRSQRQKMVALQLQVLQYNGLPQESRQSMWPLRIDRVDYYMEEYILPAYPDRKKVTVYAYEAGTDQLIDSLCSYHIVQRKTNPVLY